MDEENDVIIRISPRQGSVIVEEDDHGVLSRKRITADDLIQCIKHSLQTKNVEYYSGLLPPNTLSVSQCKEKMKLVLWYPRLHADISLYDTPYPQFPIPRLVFGFDLSNEGKVFNCRIGVVADETPSLDTLMYYYPFSNVLPRTGDLCVGANSLPIYKKKHKVVNLPAFLLSIPNNMDSYSKFNNRMGMDYRELMEHLKDKDPAYYYSDVLIPNGCTLGQFIAK